MKSDEQALELANTHHATAIEGNTLTLLETKVVIEEGLSVGGIYRNVGVYNTGTAHTPPSPNQMYQQIKHFYEVLASKNRLNAIELAAWTHAEFVRIRPFVDGNGRTSRVIMNYQLMAHGFLPITINKETRLEYFNALEAYAVNGAIQPFAEMIAALEEEQLDIYLGMLA